MHTCCRMRPQSHRPGLDSGRKRQQDLYLDCLTKQHLIMISVAAGLAVLLIIITVTAVVLTKKSGTLLKIFAIHDSLKCFINFALFWSSI